MLQDFFIHISKYMTATAVSVVFFYPIVSIRHMTEVAFSVQNKPLMGPVRGHHCLLLRAVGRLWIGIFVAAEEHFPSYIILSSGFCFTSSRGSHSASDTDRDNTLDCDTSGAAPGCCTSSCAN